MPAPTLADLKTHLNISASTQDAELTMYLAAAQAQIERRVGALTAATHTEFVDARGSGFLVSHRPTLAVQSVTAFDGSAPAVGDLTVNGAAGVVFRTDGAPIFGRLSITYTSGMASVPDAVRLAVLITARHLWNTKRGNTRRDTEDGSFQSTTGAGYALPWQAVELIAPYDLLQGVA